MAEAPELELTFQRRETGYVSNVRLIAPDDTLTTAHDVPCTIDLAALSRLRNTPREYGDALGGAVWQGRAAELLQEAMTLADGSLVRVRVAIHPSASELHGLRWELIGYRDGVPLALRQRLGFSRFLSSPARLQSNPKARLTLLAAVSNPDDLETFNLEKIDREVELALIRDVAGAWTDVRELKGSCSVTNILMALREGVDILYLVCHGVFDQEIREPFIYLQSEQTERAIDVNGRSFITLLGSLAQPPRLVVLASCQSANDDRAPRIGDSSALAALGPRMVEMGVPAVVAMQGEVMVETVSRFFPEFFKQLSTHGRVDVAMSEARLGVTQQDDWWMPVLFTRLQSGKIWYTPGLEGGAVRWRAIVSSLKNKKCTAVVGADIAEGIVGAQRELAMAIAHEHRFPLAAYMNEDLARVTQYITYDQAGSYMRQALPTAKIQAIREHFGRRLDAELVNRDLHTMGETELHEYLRELLRAARAVLITAGRDSYTRLANLQIPVFLTADPSPLLGDALRANKKQPVEAVCWWNEDLAARRVGDAVPPDYEPSVNRPLIYYVFGRDNVPGSEVVTEEDYFNFVKGIMLQQAKIPDVILPALNESSLMFLGFGTEDWGFRTLFRTLLSQEGSDARRDLGHVAVQFDVADGQVQDTRAARRHLIQYFNEQSRIDIYWGRVHEFLVDLERELKK